MRNIVMPSALASLPRRAAALPLTAAVLLQHALLRLDAGERQLKLLPQCLQAFHRIALANLGREWQ